MRLSRHFHLSEFLRSQTAARHGIDMTPTDTVIDELRRLCVDLLEPIRVEFGPVQITSGYRPYALNRRIGGSPRSAHMAGRAADFVVDVGTVDDVCAWVVQSQLPYDQVIDEFGQWLHIATAAPGTHPRYSALMARRPLVTGSVTYSRWAA